MRILFVENHEVFSALVARKFLGEHEVRIVATLREARASLAESEFDLVLLDDQLDDGRGEELALELRAQGTHPTIIGVSAYEDLNAALVRAGADAACGKLQFSQIEALIRSLRN
ncbi:MAG: response regulator [Planctomycetes bacterium]|nr:response regulator [Planctomycetota bacterium]